MAEISTENDEWSKAYDLANQALKIKLDKATRKRVKNKLKKALDIRKQAIVVIKQ
jgi:hypothetical protein